VSAPPPEGAFAAALAGLAEVRRRIAAAGGDPAAVRVVAVTKGFSAEAVLAAAAAGLDDIGENYARELIDKAAEVGRAAGDLRWHFLGAVQRNKVKALAPVVGCWQSVARVEEGRAIAAAAPGATVLVELDVTGQPGRNGVAPGEVEPMVEALVQLDLDVAGLMTVAPPEREAAARSFATLAALADRLGLPERSMGMTDDLELAVAEGSTMVRVGRALFGDRPPRGNVGSPR